MREPFKYKNISTGSIYWRSKGNVRFSIYPGGLPHASLLDLKDFKYMIKTGRLVKIN